MADGNEDVILLSEDDENRKDPLHLIATPQPKRWQASLVDLDETNPYFQDTPLPDNAKFYFQNGGFQIVNFPISLRSEEPEFIFDGIINSERSGHEQYQQLKACKSLVFRDCDFTSVGMQRFTNFLQIFEGIRSIELEKVSPGSYLQNTHVWEGFLDLRSIKIAQVAIGNELVSHLIQMVEKGLLSEKIEINFNNLDVSRELILQLVSVWFKKFVHVPFEIMPNCEWLREDLGSGQVTKIDLRCCRDFTCKFTGYDVKPKRFLMLNDPSDTFKVNFHRHYERENDAPIIVHIRKLQSSFATAYMKFTIRCFRCFSNKTMQRNKNNRYNNILALIITEFMV